MLELAECDRAMTAPHAGWTVSGEFSAPAGLRGSCGSGEEARAVFHDTDSTGKIRDTSIRVFETIDVISKRLQTDNAGGQFSSDFAVTKFESGGIACGGGCR